MKKLIFRILILCLLAVGGWYGYSYAKKSPTKRQDIATARVRQGDVTIRAFSRGELRAVRTETLAAPNLNGTVQVTRLAPLGAFAREKDLIIEFDDSEVLSRIEESQLNLESTDEGIKQKQAELDIRNNQDQVDLLSAQYAVRRAELQVQRNELLGAIDAKKNTLSLSEARQRLAQFNTDVAARKAQAEASLNLTKQQRASRAIDLTRDQARLRQTKLLATMSGLVSIRQNSFGGARQMGAQAPDLREGDQVQPGMAVADVLDLSEMELVAKVGELDRANLLEGQEALIRLDALAGKTVHGKIKSLSSTASANVMAGDPSKKFDVLFSLDMQELLKVVGATPEQIREVMATAEKNRNRPQTRSMAMSALMGQMGGMGMGGPDAMGGGAPAFGMQQPGAQGGRGDRTRGGGGQAVQGRGDRTQDGGGQAVQGRGDRTQGARGGAAGQIDSARGARGGGGVRGEGGQGFQGRGGGGFGAGSGPTDQELANAKLPPPPEEDSGLQVLLRPGLLADIEIIVEKIPNAIFIPAQAVFDKQGKQVVYVQSPKGFDERQIKLLKRSESTMVISEGLRPGEVIALADPTSGKATKKQEKSQGGASPVGSVGGPAS